MGAEVPCWQRIFQPLEWLWPGCTRRGTGPSSRSFLTEAPQLTFGAVCGAAAASVVLLGPVRCPDGINVQNNFLLKLLKAAVATGLCTQLC